MSSPLRLLWVHGTGGGLREAWMAPFAALCQIVEIDISELESQEASRDWDLLCFDLDFPEMSSLRLIPEAKSRWPSAPILLLTMQCSLELAVWALRSRVFDLLVKPITSQEITRCMGRVLEAVQARRSQSERRPQATSQQMPMEARYRPQTAPMSRLQRALGHVHKQFGRHLVESEVARICEMSPSRFCREFKAAMGMTFVDYLSRHRISEAKRLLTNRNMSVTDVAAAVGFTDPSYFTRVFRKLEGASPSFYRDGLAAGSAVANEDALRAVVDA